MVRLQDHDEREANILLVSLLMAELGVHSVAYAFPCVKIITTAVDKSIDNLLQVIPGIGEFRVQRSKGSTSLPQSMLSMLCIFIYKNNSVQWF